MCEEQREVGKNPVDIMCQCVNLTTAGKKIKRNPIKISNVVYKLHEVDVYSLTRYDKYSCTFFLSDLTKKYNVLKKSRMI